MQQLMTILVICFLSLVLLGVSTNVPLTSLHSTLFA